MFPVLYGVVTLVSVWSGSAALALIATLGLVVTTLVLAIPGLALATDLAPAHARPRVVALLCAMLLAGMVVSAVVFGLLLADFSALRLIKVIQGAALLTIVLNGGVRSLAEAEAELQQVDGVMIGRAAYETPYMLAEADRRIFGDVTAPTLRRRDIVAAFLPYVREELAAGTRLRHMTRHILGLFQGLPGARAWRRTLTVGAVKDGAGLEVIEAALGCLSAAALDGRAGENADRQTLHA